MNVASLELCKELYELSGWGYNFHAYGNGKHDLTDRCWRHWEAKTTGSHWWTIQEDYDRTLRSPSDPYDGRRPTCITHRVLERVPAYDLGYLLRKLPWSVTLENFMNGKRWEVMYCSGEDSGFGSEAETFQAATPEDAVAKLAIELFKQGVLK